MRSRLLTVVGIAVLMVLELLQFVPSPVDALDPFVGDFWQYDYDISDSGGLEVIGTVTYSVGDLGARLVGGTDTDVYVLQMATLGSISGTYLGLPVKGQLTGSGSSTRVASDSTLIDERAAVSMDVVLAGFLHDHPSGGRIASYDPPLGDLPVDQLLEKNLDRVSTSHVTGTSWTEVMGSNDTEILDQQVTVTTSILDNDTIVTTKAGIFSCYKLEILRQNGTESTTSIGYYSISVGNFVKQEGTGLIQGLSGNMTLKSFRYSGPTDKTPPIAESGSGILAARGSAVVLDGTRSSDNVGIENYTWTFTDNGSALESYGSIVWVTLWTIGNHSVMLTVRDAAGLSDSDTTWIEVVDAPDNPPTANAGPDQTISFGEAAVLNASGSTDDFGIINFTWEVVETQTTFYGVNPVILLPDLGIFTVVLIVMDTGGQTSEPDTLTVTIIDMSPPVADAGRGRTAAVGTTVVLDGSGSTDNVGIVNYTWTYDDNSETRHSYEAVVTTVFETVGNHTVELNVSDAAGFWSIDTTWVEVFDIPDEAPTANAGLDRTVAFGAIVVLDGSGSKDDFGVANYTWTIPLMDQVLYGQYAEVRLTQLGMISVELVVTDTIGQKSAPDTVLLDVEDMTPPIADAGPDIMADVGEAVALNGSGSYDNVALVYYVWTFDDVSVSLEGVAVTYTFNTTGLHVVTLTVADAAGLSDFDVLIVAVTDSTDPVAHAGEDQTVFVGDAVTLNGSSSTDNVGIVNYTWTVVGDPDLVKFGEKVQFVADTEGIYLFVLTVRDAHGNLDQDGVTVTVIQRTDVSTSGEPNMLFPIVTVATALTMVVLFLVAARARRLNRG